MSSKSVLHVIPSIVAALGVSAIPAGIVLVGCQSAETAMVLYFLENVLLILFVAARVRLLAPAQDRAYTSPGPGQARTRAGGRITFRRQTSRDRGTLLAGYLTLSVSFSLATGVFLFLFLFLIVGASISSTIIISGLLGIAGFQVFAFGTDLVLLGRLSPRRAEMLLEATLGRVALLYLAVALGVLLTLVAERWFVLPFAILKTDVDLAVPIQAFRARSRRPTLPGTA